MNDLTRFLATGGPAIWAIAALSVITVALILWKVWRLAQMGAWSGGSATGEAVALWGKGQHDAALAQVSGRASLRARLAHAAMTARSDDAFTEAQAREETTRVARSLLAEARIGLRALELIAAIAPLLGLLGTVLGMIAAFQALQAAGTRADPAALAGGIWEALLTTAAGMAVAIPASMALTWCESVVDRVQADMEDAAVRIFTRGGPER
jgi:biopolymer transport protein ExbB